MLKRILVAVPIAVVLLLAVFLQGWVLAVFAVAISLMCQFEVVRAFDKNGMGIIKTASFLYAGVLALLFLLSVSEGGPAVYLDSETILIIFTAFVLAAFIISVFSKRHDVKDVVDTVFTYVYPQFFFALFYMLIIHTAQPLPVSRVALGSLTGEYFDMLVMLLMVFIPAVFSDTFAYFFGRAFGKKKLCRR
jgi:phosphatidate cytidylyltransferase